MGMLSGTKVYVIRLWMQEPGKQILKAAAPWHERIYKAESLAGKLKKAALIVNASGFVSPLYPWIPETYPGTSEDYYYTPLGSLTITNGELYRNLEGVPYTGLTLEAEGCTCTSPRTMRPCSPTSPRRPGPSTRSAR